MSICTLAEVLSFLGVDSKGTFTITAANDVLVLTSDEGAASIDCADGTYEGAALATELASKMNADDTLTGSVITFVVTYSSTTYKFTIDATTGHTIAYTHTGSDAGSLFGFDEAHSAAQTITSDNAVPGDPADKVQSLHNGAEAAVKTYCQRTFDSDTYTHEYYNGNGEQVLSLDNYPIISLARISTSRESAIKIKNTSTDADNAYVSVDSDSLDYVVSGGDNAGSDTLSLTTYSTMALLVAAINAIGSGWSAEIYDTDWNSYSSPNLLPIQNFFCGSWAGTAADWYYLDMAGQPLSGVRVDAANGMIRYASFPLGFQNIIITYTAGYTTLPADLKLAVLTWVKSLYDKDEVSGFGLAGSTLGHMTVKFLAEMPDECRMILNRYKRPIL